MVREHHAIQYIHDPDNGHIIAFDPWHEKIREFGRGGDAAVAEQLEDQLAE